MGKIVGDTVCPTCRENGGDLSGNHLMIFEDGGTWCKRCEQGSTTTVTESTPRKSRDTNENQDITFIDSLPVHALEARGIDQDVCEHYGVKTEYSKTSGEAVAYYYPLTHEGKIVAYKKRKLPKTFFNVGQSLKDVPLEFIGQHFCTGTGKKLLIVEGQDDMLAACQILWRRYPKYIPNVVALPSGANLNAFKDNQKFLEGFEDIIFCPDKDEPGMAVANKISALLDNVIIMDISEHDANDMLKAGKEKEFINAFFRAAPVTPEGFVTVEDVFEEATKMPEWGKSWPWPSLTALTYGRRLGEGMYVGAGAKIGKSEFVNQLAKHVIIEEGNPLALFKLEEKPSMTVRRIAGKVMHKQFHIPDGDFTQAELIAGVNQIKGTLSMYDSYKATSWDTLKNAIRHSVIVQGCEDIVIDPITRLTAGMNPSDTNTELERFADEISAMAKDLGFFYYCFAHLKSPQTGRPHEEGGKVHSNQFTGSRAMMRACYYMLGIERNKDPDLPIEQRNMSQFVLLDDRAFGKAGRFDVYYHENGDYLELEREFG